MTDGARPEQSTLRDYLRVLARRKWLILQALILVPAAAIVFSVQQQDLHRASAEVLLSRQNLATSLTDTIDQSAYQRDDRIVETQANLARVPEVARRTLRAAGLGDRTAKDFRESSSVSPRANADLLVFRVTDPDPQLAMALATEYARQYTLFRQELDTRALQLARSEVETQIRSLERQGDRSSTLYTTLVDKQQQLRTMEALQTSNAFLVRAAEGATRVQPRPLRDAFIGVALGLILGLVLAILREALDLRTRTAESIATILGLPLLARLPRPPRRLGEDQLVMLEEPESHQAEAFRVLRTNLEFANLERGAQTIVFTSAVEGEGKSTTVANLAVALARARRRVVVVDLDLRRPYLHHFFDLDGRPGLTEVVLGHATLEQALTPIALPPPGAATRFAQLEAVHNGSTPTGSLEVLKAGLIPPDPGEFVGTTALSALLGRLASDGKIVLVDAPPLLGLGDALTLSSKVDGLVVVCRLGVVRRPLLRELKRVLDGTRVEKLGFVITDAEVEEGYGYAYGYGYDYSSSDRDRDEAWMREPVA